MTIFLDAQLHKLARDLNASEKKLGASFDVDREIREIHDRDMLVSDQNFEKFAHDLKGLYRWEQKRQLNVPTLNALGYLSYRLRSEKAKHQDNGREAYRL